MPARQPQIRTNSLKGHATAQQSSNSYYSLPARHSNAIALATKLGHPTSTTHKFFSKLIVVNKRWKKPPPTHKNKKTNMLTRKQTEKACLQSKKKTAEAALKMQMERGKAKRLEEKKKRDAERKQEEELRKNTEAEQRKLQASMIAETTVVSPSTQMVEDRADPSINSHLSDMMQRGSEEDAAGDEGEQRSPEKSKQKKSPSQKQRPNRYSSPRSNPRNLLSRPITTQTRGLSPRLPSNLQAQLQCKTS